MATREVAPGVTVRVPDDVDVNVASGAPERPRRRQAGAVAARAGEPLTAGLVDANFEIAAQVDLVPRRGGTRALRRTARVPPTIEVQVSPDQSALVLIEGKGGVYAWSYPQEAEGGRPARRGQRLLVFDLAPSGGPRPRRGAAPVRRGVVLGWIAEKLIDPVRAYVLKFAAKKAIDLGVDYIEGDNATGLVSLARDDVEKWRPGGAPIAKLAKDRAAKILLMLHGTFSSTAGSFGALVKYDAGVSFLASARKRYDLVLGFDHKTLAETPEQNAAALMAALDKLGLPQGSSIDAVAFSRGGLVYRVLAENLLAKQRPDLKLGKAIFVGATNSGTHLAEPQNWAAMVDLYTNISMAAARALTTLAGGAALNPATSFVIKTLGRFVQLLSQVAITDDRVPGLAAMQPTSTAVKALNEAQGGLDRLAAYYAITSNFVAKLDAKNGITRELGQLLLDRVTNRLFKVDNDLVVDTASMTECGTRDPRFEPDGKFAFGDTEDVYHTVYFATEQVPQLLSGWLDFEEEGKPPRRRTIGTASSPRRGDAEYRGLPIPAPTAGGRVGVDALESLVRENEEPRRRRATGRRAKVPPPSEVKPTTTEAPAVSCHFAAEMNPAPPLEKRVPLFVTISREKIDAEDNAASKATVEPIKVDTLRKITVEVIARKNARVLGDSKIDIDVPDKRPEVLRFEVEGLEKGIADILVEARQGPRLLISFVLEPVFKPNVKKLAFGESVAAAAVGSEEPAVLRIYEIHESSSRLTLRFDLSCLDPNLSVSESRQLPDGFSRDLYVKDALQQIEDAWSASARVYKQFLLRLQANGIEMANSFLPEPVRQALWQYRDQIRAIQVISEEPLIPWELLYVTDAQAGTAGKGFLSEWGLVRWLHNAKWPGRRLALRPDRVHYIIPNYVDGNLKLAGAQQERAMLKTHFPESREVKAESVAAAQFLSNDAKNCDLLHFACHGEATQRAVLRADLLMAGTRVNGKVADDPLSAQVVKAHARFATEGANPIVFINACQTGRSGAGLGGVGGFADAFLRPNSKAGAGAFVGALWSVDDKLAYGFADAFYGALKEKKTLVEAARAAREKAKSNEEFTWLSYTVYGNPFARVAD